VEEEGRGFGESLTPSPDPQPRSGDAEGPYYLTVCLHSLDVVYVCSDTTYDFKVYCNTFYFYYLEISNKYRGVRELKIKILIPLCFLVFR